MQRERASQCSAFFFLELILYSMKYSLPIKTNLLPVVYNNVLEKLTLLSNYPSLNLIYAWNNTH